MGLKSRFMRLFNSAKTETYWSGWKKNVETIDQVIHDDLTTLVSRSREQYANSDYVRRFVQLSQTNIVGDGGISVQSTVLDRRGTPDLPVQRVIETSWADFSRSVTPCGMSRPEFESIVVQGCAIDGEVFITPIVSKAYKYGVAFRFVDPVYCPPNYHDDPKRIRHGIEYSEDGAPVAYYFRQPGSIYDRVTHQWSNLDRVPASQMWHIFAPEWVGQKRGIPWVATSLGRLKDLIGYEEAAIINARVGATKMGFFETTGDAEYVGDKDGYGDLIMEAEPASFEVLPEGLKLSQWNPDYPHQQFGEFVNANLRGIAAGLGVSHHSLTGDMSGVNYTSSRTALLDERDQWRRKQNWLINRSTRPMFEAFLLYGIDSGKITFNGRPLREQPEYYFSANFSGRRWAWVDPQKEITAAREAVALHVKSRSDIIRDMGKDPETVWAEIAKENQLLDALGLTVKIDDNQTEQVDQDE